MVCWSQPGYLAVRVCPSHSEELSWSIAHCLSAIDVGHTPRDLSQCIGHNRVISRYGCVRHTPRDIAVRLTHHLSTSDVGHTPRDLSLCVGHNWVISRYGCVRHTLRDITVHLTHHLSAIDVGHTLRDLSRCVVHNLVIFAVLRKPRDIAVCHWCPSHIA